MKIMIEEEEDNQQDQSKVTSVQCISTKGSICSKGSISLKDSIYSKDSINSKDSSDSNQLMLSKEFGYLNTDEKNRQIIQIILQKMQQKMSHVVCFDLLVDIDSRGTIEDQQEEQFRGFDLLHHMKPVYSVEKRKGYVSFHIPERELSTIDINYSIALLEQQQSQVYKEFAQLLRQMQAKLDYFEKKITLILEGNSYNMEFMTDMKQKRQQYIQNYCDTNILTKKDKGEQFINIAGYSVCVLNKSMHLSYLVKTRELIYLLGTDEDQITRIAMKKSQLDIFSFESRNIIQKIYINYILHGITKHREQNFNILTYDNISVSCPVEFDIKLLKFPDELQYDPLIPCDDIIVISRFDVQPFHIQKVLGLRKQVDDLQKLLQNFDQDLEYNVQSELFLQKYYTKLLKKIQKREKNNEKKERQIKSLTCGYRLVSQSKQ